MKKILTNEKIRAQLMLEFGISRPTLFNALRFKSYTERFAQFAERDNEIRNRAFELGGIEIKLAKTKKRKRKA
jgi:hypothetical protein